ncbi:hypothetical protein A2V68_00425 [candidate division Kazan bacterium RBG_13_50_9]|uniref:Uncharacterized protein n=1 Tax=candidate division Kazan bacterium RBG_13_50_9 TaxID=1798535 RepID=A0A1F4NS08_UNCK3|nr:MAG: hypothetical protein A2V68_00425 [candidate division Kazan bacterium RBG_13_50_9]
MAQGRWEGWKFTPEESAEDERVDSSSTNLGRELPPIEETVEEGMRLLRGELLRIWDDLANKKGWGPNEPWEFIEELSVYGKDFATTRPLQRVLELYQDQRDQEIDEQQVAEGVLEYEKSIRETAAWKDRYGKNAPEVAHNRARRLVVAGGFRKTATDTGAVEKFTVQDYLRYWNEQQKAA